MSNKDIISLKWGTLKHWKVHSDKCLEILKQWASLGYSESAMYQHDTAEQKELLCQLIDESTVDKVYLDWDNKYVSKEDAKKYIREYK